MLDFVGLDASSPPASDREVIKPELRHNRLTVENMIASQVRSDVLDLYLSLCAEADWIDTRSLDRNPSSEEIAALIADFRSVLRRHAGSSGPLLNHAALERDIFRSSVAELEEKVRHVTAQRDWQSEDRDKLARFVEQHEAAAASQQAIIRDLTERLNALETENGQIRMHLDALKKEQSEWNPPADPSPQSES